MDSKTVRMHRQEMGTPCGRAEALDRLIPRPEGL